MGRSPATSIPRHAAHAQRCIPRGRIRASHGLGCGQAGKRLRRIRTKERRRRRGKGPEKKSPRIEMSTDRLDASAWLVALGGVGTHFHGPPLRYGWLATYAVLRLGWQALLRSSRFIRALGQLFSRLITK